MINIPIILAAAIIPMIVGSIWYGPLFGKAWMKAANMTEEKIRSGNMPLIYGLSLVFSFILTMFYHFAVNHTGQTMTLFNSKEQHGMGMDVNSDAGQEVIAHLTEYHAQFETFTHGMAHGFLASLLFLLPVFATNAMFERKGAAYVLVNWGYWTITIMLMMGVIGEFSNTDIQQYIDALR